MDLIDIDSHSPLDDPLRGDPQAFDILSSEAAIHDKGGCTAREPLPHGAAATANTSLGMGRPL
jgi:hypothetical protein